MKTKVHNLITMTAIGALTAITPTLAQLPSVPGATTTVLATIPSVGYLDVSADGTLWVTYFDGVGKLRKVTPSGQWTSFGPDIQNGIGVFVDRSGAFSSVPGQLIVGASAAFYSIAADETTRILWPHSAGGFDQPYGLYLDHTGRLLIACYNSESIPGYVSVSTGGQPASLFTDGINGAYVTEDKTGRILVGGQGGRIKLFTDQGTLLKDHFVDTGRTGGVGVWRGRGAFWGDLVYTIDNKGQLLQIDLDGAATVKGLHFDGQIADLKFTDDGLLYVSDYSQGRILKIEPLRTTIQCSAVDICWNSTSNITYQVQYQSALTTNQWKALGSPVIATNETTCVTDVIRRTEQRFYRAVEQGLADPTLTSPTLTAITVLSTDANGSDSGGQYWVSHADPNGVFDLWLAPGKLGGIPDGLTGAFLYGPGAQGTVVNVPIKAGESSFTIFAEPGPIQSFHAINLFFDGHLVPDISAKVATQTGVTVQPFSPNSGSSTLDPNTGRVPGSGKLVYSGANGTVTLTDFSWSTPSVNGIDRVGIHGTAPDGQTDFVGSLTLRFNSN